MEFKERIERTSNDVNKRLFRLMESKRSNLCLAMDVESMDQVFDLADRFGPHIVALKLHVNHLMDFDYDKFSESLSKLKERHQFLVFEDSKFADIGSTNMKSYGGGIFRIESWADLVTAHVVPGPESIGGLKKSVKSPEPRACLLIAQMSSAGSVGAIEQSRLIAQMHPDYVAGFVSQSTVLNDSGFIQFTPGVNIGIKGDGVGQQYVTPEEAIIERGADVIIVGRGIIKAEDPEAKLMEYKERGFNSYLEKVKRSKSSIVQP